MGVVRARVRADLRTRWVSWLALALAIGLGGAVVLTAIAGARRTSTAYPRFLEASRAEDVLITLGPAGDPELARALTVIRAFPQVDAAAIVAPMLVHPPDRSSSSPYHYAGIDRRYGSTIDRPNVLEGRRPGPDRPNEVLINRAMAKQYGFEVGDTIDWEAFSVAEEDEVAATSADGTPVHLRVVGIGVHANEVVATAPYDSLPFLYLTPAFFEKHPERAHVYSFLAVRLRNGQADAAGFRREFNSFLRQLGVDPGGFQVSERFERNAQVRRAIQPQVIALGIFAAATAAALLMVLIQVVARRISSDVDEYPALTAIGMSRQQLFATTMTRVALTAVVGTVLAVVGAALASPLMPIGPARLAEPNRGFAFNWVILGLGGLVIIGLVVSLAAIPAWRAARAGVLPTSRRAGPEPKSRWAEALASAGFPAPSVIGVRNALQPGRGKTRVPVRSAIVVSGLAIALVVAAFAFSSNLDRLADTPKLYGWDWTFKAGVGKYGVDTAATMTRVRGDADVEAVALANFGAVRVGGRDTPAVGIDSRVGTVFPTLLEGRAPETNDEIVLGTRTLRRADAQIGDTIEISSISIRTGCEDCGPDSRRMRIVGRAVFPQLGLESYNPTNLGEGAATTAEVLAPPDQPDERYTVMLIRLKPGADVAAARKRLNGFLAPQGFCISEPDCVRPAERPGDISNYDRVRGTSLALAVALALIALGLLVHVLVSSVRRRRRDIAVLKTLGFSRRQVSSVTAWQASTIAALALVVGVPLGLAFGSILWRVFADQLGVAPDVSLPIAGLLVAVPAAILLANLIAWVPALLAARTHPAKVLRSE